MQIPPLPDNIGDALDIEDTCRSILEEWHNSSPIDRVQRVFDTPNIKQYIVYCETVIEGIDTWRSQLKH